MKKPCAEWLLLLAATAALGGCFTDAATRLAYDIESGVGRLGKTEGAKYSIEHKTPSASGECTGPYQVQVDKVGALVIWCYDETGKTVSSHTTSYYARYADTPQTWIVKKPARATLIIDIERRGGRAVITDVR